MWKPKIFGGKKDKEVQKIEKDTSPKEEILKAQDVERTEPLQGTEKEIEKKAEEGMEKMGFVPAIEKLDSKAEKKLDSEVKIESPPAIKLNPNGYKPRIRGNDYCPCGSNKKFKKCCALDAKKVEKFQKTMDIRVANAETARKHLKNAKIFEKNKAKLLEKTPETVEVKA